MTAPQSPERGEGRLSAEDVEALAAAMTEGLLDGKPNPDREDLLDECRDLIGLIAPAVEAIVARREREAAERERTRLADQIRSCRVHGLPDGHTSHPYSRSFEDWLRRGGTPAALASGRAASGADSEEGQR